MGYGVSWLQGHSGSNDDLTAKGPSTAEKEGYEGDVHGDGWDIISSGQNHAAEQDYTPGDPHSGGGNDVVNGYAQAGTNAFDKDVDRYRQMGADGQNRQAVQLDQGQSDQSRGLQMGSLGMMGVAAQGGAPSRAAALGQAGGDSAIRAAGANMAAARSPGQAIVAAGQGQGGASQQMTQLGASVADQRAKEMAVAQQGYAKAAQGVEGQDIQAATTNAQLQAQQRALNESRQEGMEGRAWDVRSQQQRADDDYQRNKDAQDLAIRKQQASESAADGAATDQDISTVASIASMGFGSDERMKTKVRPMGSLGHLFTAHGAR